MPHDPARVADTRGWLRRAADDLRGAEIDLAATPPLTGDAAFHCQQAAEKALKARVEQDDLGSATPAFLEPRSGFRRRRALVAVVGAVPRGIRLARPARLADARPARDPGPDTGRDRVSSSMQSMFLWTALIDGTKRSWAEETLGRRVDWDEVRWRDAAIVPALKAAFESLDRASGAQGHERTRPGAPSR